MISTTTMQLADRTPCTSTATGLLGRHGQAVRLVAARRRQRVAVNATGTAAGEIRLYYRTNWGSGKLHGSLQGGAWKDYQLKKVTSAPGKWLSTTIPVNGSSSGPVLEFVVNDGADNWDKPPTGGNYTITAPGTYALRQGKLQELPPLAPPPVMIVSDLDGTMIGDDAATAAFKDWWENEALLRGGLLVYNTGRALDSFKKLLQDKSHCLAHPDVLISAVGTKIYNFTSESGWKEDMGWSKQLDHQWNVAAVRDAAYAALAKVGKDVMHFRPPDEQNDHKVTCGVNCSVLERVLDHIATSLEAAGVKANVITSGTGDWRFLDIVPIKAGKLEALEYVRKTHGFPLSATIACGDSGNDILMLSGQNLAIVVGNAQPDLVKWLQQHERGDESPLAGKQRLLKTQKHEAYGILEGLEYYGYK